MNRLILILILTFSFQNLIKADEIRDFQIEGMSLYDDALEYFSKKQIIKNEENFYKNKKYTTATLTSSNFKKYQDVQISYNTKSKNYKLLDISGIVDMDYKRCLKEIKSIAQDFNKMFSNTKYEKLYEFTHNSDKSGESKVSDMYWEFNNGDKILLACYNWNTKYGKKNSYVDELRVTISSKEFDNFLTNEAY
jgi:hypothetical protein